jgi:hypothetical protein
VLSICSLLEKTANSNLIKFLLEEVKVCKNRLLIMPRKREKFRNIVTGEIYRVRDVQDKIVVLESRDGKTHIIRKDDLKSNYKKTTTTRIYNFISILVIVISILSGLLAIYFFFLVISYKGRGDAFEAYGFAALFFSNVAIFLPLLFYGGVWFYRRIAWIYKKFIPNKKVPIM